MHTKTGGANVSLYEIIETFQNYNEKNGIEYGFQPEGFPVLTAVIVFKQSNFTKEYSELSRSYRVTSQSGKRFFNGMLGNSMIGDCLDGSDQGVRLDAYNWKIERCYFEEVKAEG